APEMYCAACGCAFTHETNHSQRMPTSLRCHNEWSAVAAPVMLMVACSDRSPLMPPLSASRIRLGTTATMLLPLLEPPTLLLTRTRIPSMLPPLMLTSGKKRCPSGLRRPPSPQAIYDDTISVTFVSGML